MKDIIAEQLSTITKLVMDASLKRPNPQVNQEQEMLTIIANMTDYETANKAKDLLHSEKHTYDFHVYLHWLSELSNLLARGVPKDEALIIIGSCAESKKFASLYQNLINVGIL